jgi:hypothetical protein
VSASLFRSVTIPANALMKPPSGGPGSGPPIVTFQGTATISPGTVLAAVIGWDIMRFFPDAASRVLSVTVGPSNPHYGQRGRSSWSR